VSWGLGMRLFDRKPMAYLMVLLAETEVILSLDLGEYWTYKGQIIDLTIFLQYSEKNWRKIRSVQIFAGSKTYSLLSCHVGLSENFVHQDSMYIGRSVVSPRNSEKRGGY
jgi:hypothetical protein